MATLTLTYGTMAAGKSSLALQLAHQLRSSGGTVELWTFGDRSGAGRVTSRLGIWSDATALEPGCDLAALRRDLVLRRVRVLVVDEVQFASVAQVDLLACLVDEDHIDVHTFGLGADFRLEPFPATARLFAVADEVRELPLAAYCWCGRRGRCHVRVVDGVVVREGEQMLLGDVTAGAPADDDAREVSYRVVCRRHWRSGEIR